MDTDPAGTSITLQLILMVILTMTNAYFAASEMAIVSVNKGKSNAWLKMEIKRLG